MAIYLFYILYLCTRKSILNMSIGKNVALVLSAFCICLLLSCSEEHSLEEFERIK
jgi:hypothetical protein